MSLEMPLLPGSSGSPIFSDESKVVGIAARSWENYTEGTSVEHIKEIVRHVKEHGNFDGWLEVRSKAIPIESSENSSSGLRNFEIESVSKVRDRLSLAQSVIPKYRAAHAKEQKVTGLDSLSKSELRRTVGAASILVSGTDLVRDSLQLFK